MPNAQKTQTKKKTAKNKIGYVQDFLPIKNVEGGIIETKDGRFVKILEFEPINFVLRSPSEKNQIINQFASYLKISPVKIQFKIITRKANSDKYIDSLRRDLAENEEDERNEENESKIVANQKRHELIEKYIELIRYVGNREALTRRFFLIFEYEAASNYKNSNTKEDIYNVLINFERTAKNYLKQCGNQLIEPDQNHADVATAEILYTFFNRQTCTSNTFADRINRVVKDCMTERNLIPGFDDAPNIPIVNFIAPRGIDLSKGTYLLMDGLYYTYLYIRSDGYQPAVYGGWTTPLINAGEGIDIDMFLRRENKSMIIDKVARKIRLNRVKMNDTSDTQSDFEELNNAIRAGHYIKASLSNGEDLFWLNTIITISATSYDDLMYRKQTIIDNLKAQDIAVNDCRFRMEEALNSVMPLNKIDKNLFEKSKRNLMTSGAASIYPFTSFEMSDDNGILLGINRQNNSLCIVDIFNSKVYKNANMTLLGTSGSGKTFTMQLMTLRMRMRNTQVFILAPLKGHEFQRACEAIGGQYIKISPGSSDCINMMEIRKTLNPDLDLLDGVEEDRHDSILAKKIQQVITFIELLIPDMTNEEEQMLDEAIVRTYAKKGIMHDNSTVFVDEKQEVLKEMPILGDLYDVLKENEATSRIHTILSKFVTGSAKSFNNQTNVDLTNKYIVLDISELSGKILPAGMFVALDSVWDSVKSDRTKKKAVVLDEIWRLIGANANKNAAEFILEIFKIIRGHGGSAIAATQDINDFFSYEDGKYGRAILNNSKTKIILNLETEEADRVQEILHLSDTEISNVIHCERGEALLSTNNNNIPIRIQPSIAEEELITTDRAQLEYIVQRKQMLKKQQDMMEGRAEAARAYESTEFGGQEDTDEETEKINEEGENEAQ